MPDIDSSVPHIARVYDYWLGGKDNFAADRALGEKTLAAYPNLVFSVRANRAFLARAVRFLAAEMGIRQFLDIGTGIPTANNTHEVAQRVAPQPALRPDVPPRAPSVPAPHGPVPELGWAELRAAVAACTRCPLSATRTQTVFGVGERQADLMVIGEAPGQDVDAQGEPFVGRAGQLLNSMLHAIGLAREQAPEIRVQPTHQRPLTSATASCAVADVADLVGEYLGVEQMDPLCNIGLVGE